MKKLEQFIDRIYKISKIEIEVVANYPFVYLNKVDGKVISEKFKSEHGFLIGVLPVSGDQDFVFSDISELFKVIKKYKK